MGGRLLNVFVCAASCCMSSSTSSGHIASSIQVYYLNFDSFNPVRLPLRSQRFYLRGNTGFRIYDKELDAAY